MKRLFVCAAVASLLAATVGACDDGGYDYNPGFQTGREYCSQYESCGSCTPILGCGWCTGPTGAGTCAADPDQCPTQEFTWTWDPSGCRTPADASVGGLSDGALFAGDAGTPFVAVAPGGAQDAANPVDVADAGGEASLEGGEASSPCASSSGDASGADVGCD